MMLFDPRAALQEIEKQAHPPASSASFASFCPKTHRKEASEAKEAAPQPEISKIDREPKSEELSDLRHGFALGSRPKTWTGKIVSLDEWRRLSEWEKHGPDGRHWNGNSKQWEHTE